MGYDIPKIRTAPKDYEKKSFVGYNIEKRHPHYFLGKGELREPKIGFYVYRDFFEDNLDDYGSYVELPFKTMEEAEGNKNEIAYPTFHTIFCDSKRKSDGKQRYVYPSLTAIYDLLVRYFLGFDNTFKKKTEEKKVKCKGVTLDQLYYVAAFNVVPNHENRALFEYTSSVDNDLDMIVGSKLLGAKENNGTIIERYVCLKNASEEDKEKDNFQGVVKNLINDWVKIFDKVTTTSKRNFLCK